jgi:hypothetical protein
MNSISFVWARYWVRRFLILNCHETGIWRLRPRREVKSRWRLLDEKNDTILRRCSSRLLQSSSTCWTFSKASHPLRQLGSAFWSIRWRKALRYVCSERRRWRLMFTRLSGEKCQLILLMFSRILTVVFLQTCRQWIHSAIHWLRKIPICSAADSIFRILFPDGCKHSLDAKLSAVSFPMMPVWLGIQISVTFVPVISCGSPGCTGLLEVDATIPLGLTLWSPRTTQFLLRMSPCHILFVRLAEYRSTRPKIHLILSWEATILIYWD